MGIKLKGSILDDQVYEWVRFFKDQVWGRFRNTCSHTRTTITPKLAPRKVYLYTSGTK